MHFIRAYSHHNGRDQWRERVLDEWLTDIFERPDLIVGPGATMAIRDHVKTEFAIEGWAYDVKIDQERDLTVFGTKDDLAFQLQTGNISRAAYDLLKLQHLFTARRIEAAALALPTKDAALKIGSNIASFERVMNELMMFDRTITVPIFLVAFE
jgi:hypothetical protein